MNPEIEFAKQCRDDIDAMDHDTHFRDLTRQWIAHANAHRYSYHFTSLGRPAIQYPQDLIALQELIWAIRPDLIVETGIAHGGSLIHNAAQLALLDHCEAAATGTSHNPRSPWRQVIGIDIDIRPHNRQALDAHPLAPYIHTLQGSSTDPDIINSVHAAAANHDIVLVLLDSNHTHEHVLAELEAYAPLVTPGSYCIVYDTIVEFLPPDSFPDRPWDVGNNPWTATREYLQHHPEYTVDHTIPARLQITVAPDGYLRRS